MRNYQLAFFSAALFGAVLSGCSKLGTMNRKPQPRPSSPVVAFGISEARNENAILLVFGVGDGAIPERCELTGTPLASNCKCHLQPGDNSPPTQIDVVQVDSNSLICDNSVSGFSSGQVSIYLQNANSFTNSVALGLASSGDPNAFVKVERFQGADLPCFTDMGLDKTICDPVQMRTQGRRLTLNFYTTNPGLSLQLITALSGKDTAEGNATKAFEFSTQPLPGSAFLPSITTQVRQRWENLLIAAQSDPRMTVPNSAIYDPNRASNPKHDFVVARSPVGVFTTPVYAKLAPGVFSAGQNSTDSLASLRPPLGYAAARRPDGTCPALTSQEIPSGYSFRKLWHFKINKPPRYDYVPSPSSSVQTAFELFCNPGGIPNGDRYVTSCGDNSSGSPSCALDTFWNVSSECAVGSNFHMASRVIMGSVSARNGLCTKFDPLSVTSSSSYQSGTKHAEIDKYLPLPSYPLPYPWSLAPSSNPLAIPSDSHVGQFTALPGFETISTTDDVFTVSDPALESSSPGFADITPVIYPFLGSSGQLPRPPPEGPQGLVGIHDPAQPGRTSGNTFPLCVLQKDGPSP